MRRTSIVLLLLAFIGMCPVLHAQKIKDGDRLAMQFFEKGQYAEANTFFADLFDRQPEAWYPYYFKSLMGAKDYSKAEKITRKLLKQNHLNVYLYVNIGKVYKAQGDLKKEKDAYERAIRELEPIQPHIENLANAFKDDQLYNYAIDVYNKGRRANPDYPYFYERAEVYKLTSDYVHMISEYLDALEFRDSEINTVQAQLQNSLGYDDEKGGINNPLLRQELQRRIQKHPEKEILAEFLIFILKQQRDFEGAFVQCRSLDKRLREDGRRVLDLARVCKSNSQWNISTRCYQYVIDKGVNYPFFDIAALEILDVEYLALTTAPQLDHLALTALETKLDKARGNYEQNAQTPLILKDLAMLRAYYLDKKSDAIQLLVDAIATPGIDNKQQAEYKLLLGDIYLVDGEIWDASLLYSQVEKAFKFEAIGNDAKFRNAKLSFYAGDFAWAKTQADVLKGSTTKLIANDALDLSLIITDALGVDTNDAPLKMFASAELLVLQHRYSEAVARMDSINLLFNTHTLGDDINFRKAEIFIREGKFAQAAEMYQNIIEFYPEDLYGDDAQFKLAELYQDRMNDLEKAKKAYEELLVKYPGSIYTVESRKRFRQLRGDSLNN
jgi:tetratricopeptide (TPR) repeat protein